MKKDISMPIQIKFEFFRGPPQQLCILSIRSSQKLPKIKVSKPSRMKTKILKRKKKFIIKTFLQVEFIKIKSRLKASKHSHKFPREASHKTPNSLKCLCLLFGLT